MAILLGLSAIGATAFGVEAHARWTTATVTDPSGAGARIGLAVSLAIVWAARSVGLFYLLGFVAKATAYAALGPFRSPAPPHDRADPVGGLVVLSLTAGDFDPPAVRSLLGLRWPGPRLFILHDDGDDVAARASVERWLRTRPEATGWEIRVLHRPRRDGGKAGAVNWVLERLEPSWSILFLADNDSTSLQTTMLPDAARAFDDPEVAVVQFRNAGIRDEADAPIVHHLAGAIDAFDAFASPQARFGALPFFGHNALMRLADLRRMGGLTPGFFSDDLDFTVRLALEGRRVVYRADIAFGERHPPDVTAFRRRARKWAFGCMQVARARLGALLTRPGIPLARRIGLLEFMSFYPAQALLLAGVSVEHLVLPWLAPDAPGAGAAVAGTSVAAGLLAPTAAWTHRAGRWSKWPALAWSCVLVYGGSLLDTARGVLDGLSGRDRPWIPTNLAARRSSIPLRAWFDAGFGCSLIAVPWWLHSPLVDSPATYLFAAPFLLSPLVHLAYRPGERAKANASSSPARRPTPDGARAAPAPEWLVLPLALLLGASHADPAAAATASAEPRLVIEGEHLRLDGRPFVIRGVHYSPWLPGTGPGGQDPYPDEGVVRSDLASIVRLGANAVLLHDAPDRVAQEVDRNGLVALYAFSISWHDTSLAAFERQADAIVVRIDSLRGERGIVAWILGHEVPTWVVELVGRARVEARLAELAARVDALDGLRPRGHAGWPPTRELDPPGFDLACYNLYPAWPYEVSVRGFGPFLREELRPRAKGRPLLITEFGINALEAGEARQAEIVAACWREIADSRIAGGIAFSWADEWWKNYDNPIPGRGYWERVHDAADAARHDPDPEEHYGLVRADRSPRPAYAALQREFAGSGSQSETRPSWPWVVVAFLAIGTWLLALRRRRAARTADPERPDAPPAVISTILCAVLAAGGAAAVDPGRVDGATVARADTLSGSAYDDLFGWALTGLGDVDGDGFAEIAIGARFAAVGSDTAAGSVFVQRGHPSGDAVLLVRLDGRSDDEHFGEALAGGADVDGDGVPDLAVGAPLRSGPGGASAGAVDVFRGGPAMSAVPAFTLHGEDADDWFGQSLALGDLDGDGVAEIAVGAPYNDRGGSAAGAVFVHRASDPATPWLVLTGQSSNEHFGWSVAAVGDLDGDGFGDLAVGARLFGSGPQRARGRVVLHRGGPTMDSVADGEWLGTAADDWFGQSVAAAGDVDGGGRPDVLVGAPFADTGGLNSGAAYLLRGEDPPGSAPARVYAGEAGDDQLGWSVGGAGDVNADGRPDLLLGARLHDGPGGSASGRVSVLPGGPSLSTIPIHVVDGEAANDWLGNAVGGGGSYFNPHAAAILVGAPYHDSPASAAGRAYALGLMIAGVGVEGSTAMRPTVIPNPARAPVRLRGLGDTIEPGSGSWRIYDTRGRIVRRLTARVPADRLVDILWDLRDDAGHRVAPGVYRIRGSGRGPGVPIVVLDP